VLNETVFLRPQCQHGAVMPKEKLQKLSDEALLLEVQQEMAQPRAAESTRKVDVKKSDRPVVPRSAKEKAMKNRWLAFLIALVAVFAVLFAHGEWGGAYAERYNNRLFEANAREALKTINVAAVNYSAEHGRFPATLAEMGPQGAKLLDDPMSSGKILGYAIEYHSLDSGKTYGVMADPNTRFGRNFFTDQTRVLRAGRDVRAPEYK
jgi:hypothetical protein